MHAPEHQQDGDVEAQRQDHLQELGEPERHYQEQGVRRDLPGGDLGQVLDKAATDQHHHQNEGDQYRGHEYLSIYVAV